MKTTPERILLVTAKDDKVACIQKAVTEAFGSEANVIRKTLCHDACDALLSENFDYVLADLSLPDNAGASVLTRVSVLSHRAPIVALGNSEKLRVYSIRHSAIDFINMADCNEEEWVAILQAAWERHMMKERSKVQRVEAAYNRFEKVASNWKTANG